MKHLSLAEGAAEIGVDVGPAQLERLAAFEELLRERAVPLGLIAEGDAERIRERHVLDCLRAAAVVSERDAWAYDLGSGAGLPGIVVAIARPSLHVTLLEARRHRAAFLELVVDTLGLENAAVEAVRVEAVETAVDVCFARAFAPLERAWELARRLLIRGGRLVYFAGAHLQAPSRLPEVASWAAATTPVLESGGPLVIMTRQ